MSRGEPCDPVQKCRENVEAVRIACAFGGSEIHDRKLVVQKKLRICLVRLWCQPEQLLELVQEGRIVLIDMG